MNPNSTSHAFTFFRFGGAQRQVNYCWMTGRQTSRCEDAANWASQPLLLELAPKDIALLERSVAVCLLTLPVLSACATLHASSLAKGEK